MPNDADQTKIRIINALKTFKRRLVPQSELLKKLGVSKAGKAAALQTLGQLVAEGGVLEEKGKYALSKNLGLVPAEIVKVNATFGFARIENSERDVFIPGKLLLGAMPGDLVLVKKKKSAGQLPEGEVYKVIRESARKFSGVLVLDGGNYSVMPDDYVKFPIRLHRFKGGDLRAGDKILAVISRRGSRHSEHIASAVQCFGTADKAAVCCEAILAGKDIRHEFPTEVQEQAKAIAAAGEIHPKELEARLDLRGEMIFTIDGADTKDIDDAVSVRKTQNGWELDVHIADVSYYVPYKSPVDAEAFVRGTSVYYADSVVPMLPKELSNGVCSLNPGEDRLAFSAMIRLGKDAKIESYEFKKTVICSRIKGVYSEINKLLAGEAEDGIQEKYKEAAQMLKDMGELAAALTKNRINRGGIDLESVESKIILSEDGVAADIVPRQRGVSEMFIEEFMLVANEAAARFAIKAGLPFIFRVHERPAPDKLNLLYEALDKLQVSYKRPQGQASSEELQAILKGVSGTEIGHLVNALTLRSMAKAKYSDKNIRHYGLALDDYTHFTSPIRRYPDLTVHRVLSALVTGMRHDNIHKRFGVFVQQSAARSTEREIAAMTAERSCVDAYKAEYMSSRVGGEFDGLVSSVTQFGCYVRLLNTVEGLVSIRSLPHGDWQFDGSISLVDTIGKSKIQLGDKMRVKVLSADVSTGRVDFEQVHIIPGDGKY